MSYVACAFRDTCGSLNIDYTCFWGIMRSRRQSGFADIRFCNGDNHLYGASQGAMEDTEITSELLLNIPI